jgi:DNA helicase II / ATP-dependent DNA helicase PcrA
MTPAAAAARTTDPGALLADLDPAQREAVEIVRGPLAILAGAGTGKTRVITRRAAYAIATGAVEGRHVLVVTFTDRAANEMRERLAALGQPGVAAFTFHAAALRQLRHFWPLLNDEPLPGILESKAGVLVPLIRNLPGGYRYQPARDMAQEIEWAKARRVAPDGYEAAVVRDRHVGPLPPELFARLFGRYEEAKRRAGRIDFEDMLARTVEILDDRPDYAEQVRDRYRWFSVDEYQDTSALQQALLDAWCGERDDVAVVGDSDQTIYSFTGASSAYLTGFTGRFPTARIVRLEDNHRSTPQVLAIANRILAAGEANRLAVAAGDPPKRLRPKLPGGPEPSIATFATAEAEGEAIVEAIRRLMSAERLSPGDCAILVRTNAQLPSFEAALSAAHLPFQVRGERFFERFEVRRAVRTVESTVVRATEDLNRGGDLPPPALPARLEAAWERALDYRRSVVPEPEAARQRHDAVSALLAIAEELTDRDPEADEAAFLAEVGRRSAAETAGGGAGVNLLTFHRAKGLEWPAVFLPALEEGLVPIRQASEPEELEEERRLLYVGVTRASRHLWLSSARRRIGPTGRETSRTRSRFLIEIGAPAAAPRTAAQRNARSVTVPAQGERSPLSTALRAWRTEQARAQGMPPYVIFHDATLEAIAERRPRTIAELAAVPGIGPTKLDRYGTDILTLVLAT